MEILGFMTVEKQMASRTSLRKLTYSWPFKLWMNFSELWTSLHQHGINSAGSITLNVIWTMSYSPKKSNKGNVSPRLGNLFRSLPWDSIDTEKQVNLLALMLSPQVSAFTGSICIPTTLPTGSIHEKWKDTITLFCWGMSVIRQICHPSVKEMSIAFYRLGCPRKYYVDVR